MDWFTLMTTLLTLAWTWTWAIFSWICGWGTSFGCLIFEKAKPGMIEAFQDILVKGRMFISSILWLNSTNNEAQAGTITRETSNGRNNPGQNIRHINHGGNRNRGYYQWQSHGQNHGNGRRNNGQNNARSGNGQNRRSPPRQRNSRRNENGIESDQFFRNLLAVVVSLIVFALWKVSIPPGNVDDVKHVLENNATLASTHSPSYFHSV